MSDDLVGGLDEPAELQPEPGALALASPDDDWSRADWERAAAGVLRRTARLSEDDSDDAVWTALTRTTYDDVRVPPLGTPDHLVGLTTSGRPTRAEDWDVRTANAGDNAAALEDLANGATSLWLDTDDVAGALAGVLLDLPPVVLEAGTPERARALLALTAGTELPAATNLGVDPIGARLRERLVGGDVETVVEAARMALERGVRGVVVDASAVHELGASDAQEVGYSLAAGVAYLRLLTDAGVAVDDAAALLEFRYAVTDEQLVTIAKLRAARRCWARVLELSEVSRSKDGGMTQRQHAVTSRPMLSAYDPWVNMLRGTVAAFAAGVGGAEAVTVVPFDSPLGEPDAFGRRIARNVSSLLLAESHVAAVTDPAGGAYAVEKLTDDLAVSAWRELQRIEAGGGVLAALDDGSFLERVGHTADRRARDVATRRKPITGLSTYPHLGETIPPRVSTGSAADGRDVRRWGVAFEELRAAPPDRHVFLATLGPVAQHSTRAGFATNLLAAGGITVDVAGGTHGVDDLRSAYGGQAVVCVAGTDAAYAAWGHDAADALRAAGALRVAVVSTGSTDGHAWADARFSPGDDAVAFLTWLREALR
jgi:methylmalonyl-CoA mutase